MFYQFHNLPMVCLDVLYRFVLYKEQDGTFFLVLPLREICCCILSLRASVPAMFQRRAAGRES